MTDGYLQYDGKGNLIEKKTVSAYYYYKYDAEQSLVSSMDKERVGATEYSEYTKEHLYKEGII